MPRKYTTKVCPICHKSFESAARRRTCGQACRIELLSQNHKHSHEQRLATFWNNVDKSGGENACWIWTACGNRRYGRMFWRGEYRGAHRIAYEIQHGRFPDKLYVLHSCDNPLCVNPAHLFLGTNKDNSDDRDRKGRHAHGETHGMRKLSAEQVEEIRARYDTGGVSQQALADYFHVSRSAIGWIVRRETWK